MSSINWKEYLSVVVRTFRSHYNELSDEEKSAVQSNMTFTKPCQIGLFSFENDGQMMLVTLLPELPDEIIIHENLGKDFDFRSAFGKRLPMIDFTRIFSHYVKNGKVKQGITWSSLGPNASLYLFAEERALQKINPDPENLGKQFFYNVKNTAQQTIRSQKRSTEFSSMEKRLQQIKLDAEKILDESLRASILQHTSRIDDSILNVKKMEEHEQRLNVVEQEIGGVRKLIGDTKEFQDFRVFATDVEDLKKSHTHKEIFVTEIKRLDQKIDNVSENLKTKIDALNTRIEDLKAIKFWSKRTLLEIALAILAIIATLYGAGVIKL